MATNTNKITANKSNGVWDESVKPTLTSDNLNKGMSHINDAKIQVKFDWLFKARSINFDSFIILYQISILSMK